MIKLTTTLRASGARLLGAMALFLASAFALQAAEPDYQFAGKMAGKPVEMELTVSQTDNGITGRMRYTNPPTEWMELAGETGISLHPQGNLWMNVTLWPAADPDSPFDITINHWDGGGVDAQGMDANGNDIDLVSTKVKKTTKKSGTKKSSRKSSTRKKSRR